MAKKKKKKTAKSTQKAKEPKGEPVPKEIQLLRFSCDLSSIADKISDNKSVTIKSLQKRKFTKKEILDDLKETADDVIKVMETAREIQKINDIFKKIVKEILISLKSIIRPIIRAYNGIKGVVVIGGNEKEEPYIIGGVNEDKPGVGNTLIYKHSLRGYERANEHRNKLESLISILDEETEEQHIIMGISKNNGTTSDVVKKQAEGNPKDKDGPADIQQQPNKEENIEHIKMTDFDRQIMVQMSDQPDITLVQETLAAAMKKNRRAIGNSLKRLRQLGFTYRPLGEHKGESLTLEGRQYLKKQGEI